jgi:hypothetical protein
VPVNATVCGLVVALSLSVRVPVRVPVAVGVNVTLMVQVPPLAATGVLVLQVVLAMAKSPEIAGAALNTKPPSPLFVTVTVCAVLVVLIGCDAKVNDVGFSPTVGAVPVPLSATVCVATTVPPAPGEPLLKV